MGSDNERKTWLQKLKHLVTVTESEAMAEEQAKQEAMAEEQEQAEEEKPVMEEIFTGKADIKVVAKNDEIAENAAQNDENKESENTQQKETDSDDDKPSLQLVTAENIETIAMEARKKDEEFVKQAIDAFDADINADNSAKTEKAQINKETLAAEQSNDVSTPEETDNTSTEKSDTVPKNENTENEKSDSKEENKSDWDNTKEETTDNIQQKQEEIKEDKEVNKKAENSSDQDDTAKETDTKQQAKEKTPSVPIQTKRHKKNKVAKIAQALVNFGKILNAKPDEFQPDEEDIKEGQALTAKKIKGVLDKREKKQKHEKNNDGKQDTEADENPQGVKAEDKSDEALQLPKEPPMPSKGQIIIDGDKIPMYAFEDKSPKMNVEIGKLTAVLMREHEYYLEPEQLQAIKEKRENEQQPQNPIEVITKATTTFDDMTLQADKTLPHDDIHKENEKTDGEAADKPQKAPDVHGAKTNSDNKENHKNRKKENKERKSVKEALFGDFENPADFSSFSVPEEAEETIDDYESPQDAKAVMAELNLNIRKLFFRSLITTILFVIALALSVTQRFIPDVLVTAIPNVDIMYCITNFLLLIAAVAVSSSTVKNGFKPLIGFRGNSDTAVAVAAVAAIIQCAASFFDSREFFIGGQNLYCLIVLLAFVLNAIGKMCIVLRIKDNFKFVSDDKRKYAVKILTDEKNAKKMIDNTNAEEPTIAFQRRTKFYKNFLKLSYMPDQSEKVAAKFAPVCAVCAVVVAIIHGIIYQSLSGAASSFALMACVGIPCCSLLAVNIPMKKLCKSALKNDAMIVGFPAVRKFGDTSAVMIDSRELYPRSEIEIVGLKPFISYDLGPVILKAAAIMEIANTSMTYVFEKIIREKTDLLPKVESVKYEDGRGLVGWAGGERLLIGNRELLKKYGVEPPSEDFEEPYRDEELQITYLCSSGQLVAMIITRYTPNRQLMTEIQRLDSNGVSILVRTADSNVTDTRIAIDFRIHSRSVKILPSSLGNVFKDETAIKEENSGAYVATRGKLKSMARAVSGCIKIKQNINLAIAVQFTAVVLGIVIAAIVAVLAGVRSLGVLELLLYVVFWAAASIAAPLLQRP